jgi:hypothetical protein
MHLDVHRHEDAASVPSVPEWQGSCTVRSWCARRALLSFEDVAPPGWRNAQTRTIDIVRHAGICRETDVQGENFCSDLNLPSDSLSFELGQGWTDPAKSRLCYACTGIPPSQSASSRSIFVCGYTMA